MFEPNVAARSPWLSGVLMGCSDNGYAFLAPPGRGMSHNRRTLQDVGPHVLKRPLTQQNGGPGVRMDSAAMRAIDAEFRLSAGDFVVRGIASGSLVERIYLSRCATTRLSVS